MSLHEDTDRMMTSEDTRAASIAIVLVVVVPVLATFIASLL
jgi:hypothetical protein